MADAQQLAPASTALGTSQHSAPATEARMPMMARCMSCTHELHMFCELSHVQTLESWKSQTSLSSSLPACTRDMHPVARYLPNPLENHPETGG